MASRTNSRSLQENSVVRLLYAILITPEIAGSYAFIESRWHMENAEPRGGQGGDEGFAAADSAAAVYRQSESARHHGRPSRLDNLHENGKRLVEYHSRLSLRSGVAQTGRNALTDNNTVQEVL